MNSILSEVSGHLREMKNNALDITTEVKGAIAGGESSDSRAKDDGEAKVTSAAKPKPKTDEKSALDVATAAEARIADSNARIKILALEQALEQSRSQVAQARQDEATARREAQQSIEATRE